MKILTIMALCVSVYGCASGRDTTMQFQDLNHFVVNCNQSQQQTVFLQQQYRNTSEFNRKQRAVISQALRQIRSYCAVQQHDKPSGCLTVSEQLSAEPAISVVCRAQGQHRPIINIWETEIDK